MIVCSYINLNGLTLFPSTDYVAKLEGIFDFNKNISSLSLIQDGDYFGHSKISSRNLTLTIVCNTIESSKSERALETQLNYTLKQENLKLKFKLEDDNNLYECNCQVVNRANDGNGLIVVDLYLADPNIYKIEQSEELELLMSGGFMFVPDGFTISSNGFQFTETVVGNEAEIVISGDTVFPKLEIVGECSNIKIANKTTGEVLILNYALGSEDKVTVNCDPKNRKCRLNNNINLIKYKSGSFIKLVNGSNVINVTYDGTAEVKIIYREIL